MCVVTSVKVSNTLWKWTWSSKTGTCIQFAVYWNLICGVNDVAWVRAPVISSNMCIQVQRWRRQYADVTLEFEYIPERVSFARIFNSVCLFLPITFSDTGKLDNAIRKISSKMMYVHAENVVHDANNYVNPSSRQQCYFDRNICSTKRDRSREQTVLTGENVQRANNSPGTKCSPFASNQYFWIAHTVNCMSKSKGRHHTVEIRS